MKKGAEDYDPVVARISLAKHLKNEHSEEFQELIREWNTENES